LFETDCTILSLITVIYEISGSHSGQYSRRNRENLHIIGGE